MPPVVREVPLSDSIKDFHKSCECSYTTQLGMSQSKPLVTCAPWSETPACAAPSHTLPRSKEKMVSAYLLDSAKRRRTCRARRRRGPGVGRPWGVASGRARGVTSERNARGSLAPQVGAANWAQIVLWRITESENMLKRLDCLFQHVFEACLRGTFGTFQGPSAGSLRCTRFAVPARWPARSFPGPAWQQRRRRRPERSAAQRGARRT